MAERDPVLRDFERNALIAWGTLAALAFVVTGGGLAAPIGVAGGGALMALSYLGIKSGAGALFAAVEGGRARRATVLVALVKFLGRFALLALVAYGILARLRLHPIGVLVGASVPVVAAAMLVPRLLRRAARGAPRG